MFSGLGGWSEGTRSTMSRPKPSRPPYFMGLLVMSRMVVTPRSTRIWAPMPYSRLSTGQAQLQVGVDGVVALLLEVVGPELVGQADAPALVAPQVDDDPVPSSAMSRSASWQLGPAVAAQRAEDVAGQALGVDPDEHVALARQVPLHDGQVVLAVDHRLVDVAGEVAELGGDPGRAGDAAHQLVLLAAVADRGRRWR